MVDFEGVAEGLGGCSGLEACVEVHGWCQLWCR